MTHKQDKLSHDKKFRRDKLFEDHEHQKIRRPIIFGCDDAGRLAVEKSQAKLMRKVASKPVEPSGEFGSCFCAPSKQTDPVYSITSHTTKEYKQPRGSVIHTYPSLSQNLRWNTNVETSSVYQYQTNDKHNVEEPPNFTCRCRECGSKHCRGQSIPSDFITRAGIFKDNIIRFTDNSTMTPKLNDAYCGSSTPVYTSSGKTSDVSVSGSNLAVRENYCAMALSQVYLNCDPVSILKKTRYEPVKGYEDDEYDNRNVEKDDYQEAVRDIGENSDYNNRDYNERTKTRPLRSFPKVNRNILRQNLDDEIPPRKNIYNEGISDLMVNCLPPITPPSYTERFPDTPSLKADHSTTFDTKKYASKRDEVPFAHTSESKYHYDCKAQAEFSFPSNNSSERLVTSTKKFKKTYSSKPVPCNNTQSIKFPRKVLSSESDIESYISHQSPNSSIR